jgi:hypothetical protein
MEKETEKAQEAFKIYWELGDERTVEKVASKLNKRKHIIVTWKDKWDWDKRIKKSDTNTDGELNFESLINEHTEMSLQISKSLETLIELLTEKLSNSDKYLGDMDLDDLVKLINNYIKSIGTVKSHQE